MFCYSLAKKKQEALANAQRAAAASGGAPGAPAPLRKAPSIRTVVVGRHLQELDLPPTVKLVVPNPDVIREFYVIISPAEGIWAGGNFKFSFRFPDSYPNDPPLVHCDTRLWHPNIDLEGHVCLNILRDKEAGWTPVVAIQGAILGLLFLFYEPNSADPLNFDAAREMIANKEEFAKKVRRTFGGGTVDGVSYERQPVNYSAPTPQRR